MIVRPEVLLAMNADYGSPAKPDVVKSKGPGLPRPPPPKTPQMVVKKVNFQAVQETEKLRQKQQRQLKMNAMLSAQQASGESSEEPKLNP